MTTRSSASWSLWSVAAVAVVFGALTILSGGTVLFGGDAAREAAGKVVPFVLWFNFLSGFVKRARRFIRTRPWRSRQ